MEKVNKDKTTIIPVECKSKIVEYWNSNVETHERFLRFSEGEKAIWRDFLVERIEKDSKVLEIGCGAGNITELLIAGDYDVTAIDISKEMLKNFKSRSNGCDLITGDAELLPIRKESFDVIVCRNLLCTLPNPDKAFKEWFEVLRNDGTIVIIERSLHDGIGMGKKIGYIFAALIDGWFPWRTCYDEKTAHHIPLHKGVNPEDLALLAEKAGFGEIEIEDMKEINKKRRKATPFYHKLLFENNFCLIARKKI